MRTVTFLIVHCSAVRPGQQSSSQDIDCWHRARGWKSGGYHYVVRRDGTVEIGRRLEEIGAHCAGHNAHSVGICYEGGLDEQGKPADTRTLAQKQALDELLGQLHKQFPNALIVGHHDLNPMKACPCFDVISAYAGLQPKAFKPYR